MYSYFILMKQTRGLLFLFFFSFTNLLYGNLPQSGLYFYSHENNIDKRTSLILNAGEPYRLDKDAVFTMDFDIFIRNVLVKFGYIFRIISNKEENIDFIIDNRSQIFLIVNKQDFQSQTTPSVEQWNHVRLTIDKKQNRISLQLNTGETISCPYDLKNLDAIRVNFGRSEINNFMVNDVSPFILKDVEINNDQKEKYHWTLDKHEKDIVYDELKNRPAFAHNPYWLMDNRIFWKKVAGFKATVFPQICFDSIDNRLFVLSDSGLVAYSLLTDQTTVYPSDSFEPSNEYYNRMAFDPFSGKVMYYGFKEGTIGYYDFEKKQWEDRGDSIEANYAQHNRSISPNDSVLYLFGGYGHYKYNSDFFRVHLNTGKYERFDFSHTITPRYLAAMGMNRQGDKIYIFGGRGAELGRQELSPKNFSDLYEVDLKTNKVKQQFDWLEEEKNENVYSNSLIMTNGDSCFYVLAYSNNRYPSDIVLKKINRITRETDNLADSIQFYFKDISSFCDLYYSSSLAKLIAVTAYSDDEKTDQVDIYTLDYPPLQKENVIPGIRIATIEKYLLLLAAVGIIAFGAILMIRRKKKTRSPSIVSDVLEQANKPTEKQNRFSEKTVYSVNKQSVLFLGGFQVFDKAGKNITGEFTPTLKQLLVLIILHTLKNGKGISSSKLQELLWFDKSEESARNNRSVNIRKLRVLLQELGNVDISNHNAYWTIALPDDVFSDYKDALSLIQRLQSEKTLDKTELLRLLEILSYGPLLPNIQIEWVDDFKTEFSNSVVDLLMSIVQNSNLPYVENSEIRLKIADVILGIDPINEDAVAIKCSTLYKMGKIGLAKTIFDNFTKEYRLLLGEAYTGSVKKFLG